jgi:hypothetical protein
MGCYCDADQLVIGSLRTRAAAPVAQACHQSGWSMSWFFPIWEPKVDRFNRKRHVVMSIRTSFKAAVTVAPLLLFPCVAVAQTTGALSPGNESTSPTKEEPPPGGCMPIGVTASGDTVFPYACKDFIEAQKTVSAKTPAQAHEKEASRQEQLPVREEQPPVTNPDIPPVTNASAPPVANASVPPVANASAPLVTNTSAPPVANASAPPTTSSADTDASSPAVGQKAAVEQKVVAVPDEPLSATREAAPLPRERVKKVRQMSSGGAAPGCTHFRTYDSETGMYRAFDGQPRRCTTTKQ